MTWVLSLFLSYPLLTSYFICIQFLIIQFNFLIELIKYLCFYFIINFGI